jgi:hypothetical protein
MRIAQVWIVVAFFTVTSSYARQVDPAARAIRDLVDSALVAPPELAADILLKLVERGKIVRPEWKRQVLETAWNLAPRAIYPLEIRAAVSITTDSDTGSLSAALRTGLSTAGLQSRIIAQLAKLDPKATREMFLQMAPPAAQSPDCLSDRYISHDAYFKALDDAVRTFSAEETKKGEPAKFLGENLRSLNSPEDFELSLQLLLRNDLGLNNNEFSLLIGSWVETLGRARFSDRLFSAGSITLADSLLSKGKQLELRGVPLKPAFRALRSYFVSHARAVRCGESQSNATRAEGVRVAFNKLAGLVMPDIPLITPEEIKAERFGERAKTTEYTSPSNSRVWELKVDYAHLRFGTEEQQAINDKQEREDGMKPYLTIQQRSTPEWNDEVLRFLNKLEGWSREFGQSSREIFFQKSEWHGALVYVVPDGQLRDAVLASYVRFLGSSPIRNESPPEWAMWLNRLITAGEVTDRRAWIDKIESAGDPSVAAYCRLARLGMLNPAN